MHFIKACCRRSKNLRWLILMSPSALALCAQVVDPRPPVDTPLQRTPAGITTASPAMSIYTVNPKLGTAPLMVRARHQDRSRLHSTMVTDMMWDFGDGTVVRGRNLQSAAHTYTRAGSYPVRWCLDTATVNLKAGGEAQESRPKQARPANSTLVGTVTVQAR